MIKTVSETNHDSHYLEIEKKLGIQPIVAGEYITDKDSIPRVPAKHLGTAAEYLLRAGDKGDWRADARKALNHIHRALYGFWMPVEIEVDGMMTVEKAREIVEKAISFGKAGGEEGMICDIKSFFKANGLDK